MAKNITLKDSDGKYVYPTTHVSNIVGFNGTLALVDSSTSVEDNLNAKAAFDTYDELVAAYPTGAYGLYYIRGTRMLYYWDTNGWTQCVFTYQELTHVEEKIDTFEAKLSEFEANVVSALEADY